VGRTELAPAFQVGCPFVFSHTVKAHTGFDTD
jgi:hypothetical protein